MGIVKFSRANKTFRLRRLFAIFAVGLLGIIVFLVVTKQYWLPKFYLYLDVSKQPQSADVIVILGGGGFERPLLGAALFRQGFAQQIVLSGSLDSMDYAISALFENGVPDDAVTVNGHATSTYNEAQQVLALLLKMNVHSALVVTDAFHTRRASATYRHVFEGFDIQLTFVSPESSENISAWWELQHNSQIWTEYLKMFFYWLAYDVA